MQKMVSSESNDITIHPVPLVRASPESCANYGRLVPDFEAEEVIVETWPAQGWRRVEPGTGNEGGITQGDFVMEKKGDLMIAQNHAVGGHYITGWFVDPKIADESGHDPDYNRVLVREANYHPDGGQVVCPKNGEEFVALLALPGDDVRPEDFVAFYCDGRFGLQIYPNVWHQPVFPLADRACFNDKQGRVHACVAVDFVKEFSCYLSVPLNTVS